MFQLQLKIKGYWTNSVYHPMEEAKITKIMNSLSDSYPDIDYRIVPVSN